MTKTIEQINQEWRQYQENKRKTKDEARKRIVTHRKIANMEGNVHP